MRIDLSLENLEFQLLLPLRIVHSLLNQRLLLFHHLIKTPVKDTDFVLRAIGRNGSKTLFFHMTAQSFYRARHIPGEQSREQNAYENHQQTHPQKCLQLNTDLPVVGLHRRKAAETHIALQILLPGEIGHILHPGVALFLGGRIGDIHVFKCTNIIQIPVQKPWVLCIDNAPITVRDEKERIAF